MSLHLLRDLDTLKKELLALGGLVEDAINKSTTAVMDRRPVLAEEVLARDTDIDQREVRIEEECLKLLALHQPVASDLRLIITVLKVNNDLERMGDLATNIAERALYLCSKEPISAPLDFGHMVDRVKAMVRQSLDSLVNQDADLAQRVCAADNEVDEVNREMYVTLQDLMKRDPGTVKRCIHTLSVSRHLERIADLATNIAEDVVFMVKGEVIRHRYEDYADAESDHVSRTLD